jgi:PhzF family phenazine biosynthesis protein
MIIPLYHVDAFTEHPFEGNPAAVCPLELWPPDALLQKIARENNLSETAFFAWEEDHYRIRWFTPAVEVELCGHATLASGHVLFRHLGFVGGRVPFASAGGPLGVEREGERLVLDFPARAPNPAAVPAGLAEALGRAPAEFHCWSDYWLALFGSEDEVRALRPDFAALGRLPVHGLIATAPGTRSDFVSRFFAPAVGINEDPVTGSAHTVLSPFWAGRLGKPDLHALQVSDRGGELWCELRNDRVRIGGHAVTVMTGRLEL